MPKSIKPWPLRAAARTSSVVMSLLCALSVTACGTRQTPPCEWPVNPTAPVSAASLPSERYSTSAQRDMAKWQSVLTSTPATSER